MKNKKIIRLLAFLIGILTVVVFSTIFNKKNIDNGINDVIEITPDVEVEEENPSTTEIPKLTVEDEQTTEVQEVESESFERQGEVAYNGSDKAPNVSIGNYAGLTYYSQIDTRWKNKMYSIVNDPTQTIGTSGCGPTSAAMVVSSIKGTITPAEMADLYVKYGYRTKNNGTYWSAFKWTADVFDIGYSETSNLDTAISKLKDNNYIIVSCNEGLFTYGGHFIVIVGIDGNTLKIYDPYLYNGKFNTASRRGKATVSGNTVYVSIDNFKKYANARGYFCFKNDRTEIKENNTTVQTETTTNSDINTTNYNVKITANSGLNIRSGASIGYNKVGGYAKNTIVTILAEANGWGKTNKGWICLTYTTKINNITNTNTNSNRTYTTGTYKIIASVLNVRTGPSTKYTAKKYYQLSINARKQNQKLGNYYTNGYKKGTICTVTKISGNWGLTPSGWISLNYCVKL